MHAEVLRYLIILNPYFTKWSARASLFEKLSSLQTIRPDFPPIVTEVEDEIKRVNIYLPFFKGKLNQIEAKLSLFSSDFNRFIPSLKGDDDQVKAIDAWKSEFDTKMPSEDAFILGTNVDIEGFNKILDEAFKEETDINKFLLDVKNITDVRWDRKKVQVQSTQDFNWTLDNEVKAWEVMTTLKKKKPVVEEEIFDDE